MTINFQAFDRYAEHAETVPMNHAIKAVLAHASKDKTLPILNGVHITPERVAATDRYTLALAKFSHKNLELIGIPETGAVMPRDLAEQVAKSKERVTRIELDGDRWTATTLTGTAFSALSGTDQDYPAIDRLVPEERPRDEEAPGVVNLNPDYLARMAKRHIGGKATHIRIQLGTESGKPVRIDYGHWLTAVQVPVRGAR